MGSNIYYKKCIECAYKCTLLSQSADFFDKNGGHLGFGGHFELCDNEKFYVGHIVWIQCMSICDFVLIRFTDFELEAKTRILDQISSQI